MFLLLLVKVQLKKYKKIRRKTNLKYFCLNKQNSKIVLILFQVKINNKKYHLICILMFREFKLEILLILKIVQLLLKEQQEQKKKILMEI